MDAFAAGRLDFGAHSIDFDRCALLRDTYPVHLRPKTFDVLRHLALHAGQLVTKQQLLDAVWPGASVSDDSLVQCVKELRVALHDTAQAVIRTVPRRGYLFSAEVSRMPSTPGTGMLPTQAVKFCRTPDGVSIAAVESGRGAPLVLTPSFLGHLEYDWRNPVSAPLLHFLAARSRLVRFDIRGTGLSDRDVPSLSLDAFQRDCETAVDAMGLGRYALFGLSTPGSAIAVAHAAAHPDRVTKLVLLGGFARGRKRRDCAKSVEIADALLALLRHGWGDRDSPFVRMFVSRYLPDGAPEQIQAVSELQQMTASRDMAARLWTLWNEIDIVNLLARIKAPTLVLHSRHNDVSPFSEGRRLAADIPNASLVALDTANHVPVPGEPAWATLTHAVEEFLAG